MKIKIFQSIPKIPSLKKVLSKNIGPILLSTLIALSIITTQLYNLNKKTITIVNRSSRPVLLWPRKPWECIDLKRILFIVFLGIRVAKT